jgi:hypothetical protein
MSRESVPYDDNGAVYGLGKVFQKGPKLRAAAVCFRERSKEQPCVGELGIYRNGSDEGYLDPCPSRSLIYNRGFGVMVWTGVPYPFETCVEEEDRPF